MLVTPIKTKKILLGDSLEEVLQSSLPQLQENTVVVVTSKIVSLCEKSIAPLSTDKEALIKQEADQLIYDESTSPENKMLLTIKDNILVPWAGIDESNGDGQYVLWPKNPMTTAQKIWEYLRQEYRIKNVGVLIVDSTFIPLRTGSISVGLTWCGFKPITSYVGTPDVFGKPLKYTTTSMVDSLSIAAGLTMGEANNQQPLCVITDIPDIEFVDRVPNKEELDSMHYPIDKDMFGPLLRAGKWEKSK
ncbi:MAG TPA: coenzyme F420-0:L-glutamate ligase [Candidatus Eisenbacteria bacterium]|nr:coenzyme F420-0:L-glutamate ligase [Candidatus Eisenbacteria bacterium]